MTKPRPSRRWLAIVLCTIVAMLDGFDAQAISYVAPSIAHAWRVPIKNFGPIFGAALVGLTLGALFLGPLADRIGRKRMIMVAMLLVGIFSLATALAQSLTQLGILRFLTGIGLGAAMPNIIALTNEQAPPDRQSLTVTIMFCGFPLGAMLGGFAVAPFIEDHGWQLIFVVGGAAPLLLLPLLYIYLPETGDIARASDGDRDRRELGSSRLTLAGAVAALFQSGRAGRTMLIWLSCFMNLLLLYTIINWLPALLHDNGMNLADALRYGALFHLGGVFGGVLVGRLLDAFPAVYVLSLIYAIGAAGVAAMALADQSPALLLVSITVSGLTLAGAQIGLNAVAAESYPTALRATGVGWALGVGRLGSILGPILAGSLLGAGWTASTLLLAGVAPALICAIAASGLRSKRSPS